jgi:hypothetical protein
MYVTAVWQVVAVLRWAIFDRRLKVLKWLWFCLQLVKYDSSLLKAQCFSPGVLRKSCSRKTWRRDRRQLKRRDALVAVHDDVSLSQIALLEIRPPVESSTPSARVELHLASQYAIHVDLDHDRAMRASFSSA